MTIEFFLDSLSRQSISEAGGSARSHVRRGLTTHEGATPIAPSLADKTAISGEAPSSRTYRSEICSQSEKYKWRRCSPDSYKTVSERHLDALQVRKQSFALLSQERGENLIPAAV